MAEIKYSETMSQWPKVAIIVLNWNGWQDTLECLKSVQQLTYPNYLTVVVDNGSVDDSVERIKTWMYENLGEGHVLVEYTKETALEGGEENKEETLEQSSSNARVVLVKNMENLGFTGGNNVAIHYALHRIYPADYVFLLNNDAKVKRDCLTHLVDVDQKVNAGIVGPIIMDETGRQIQFRGQIGSYPLLREFLYPLLHWRVPPFRSKDPFWTSYWVNGAAMLIRRDVLNTLHSCMGRYLNTGLFCYGEEIELSSIAYDAGYKSVVAKEAVVYHNELSSSGGRYNPIAYYYMNRNRVLLARNLLPLFWRGLFYPLNLLVCIGRLLRNLLAGRGDSAWAILCGLIDGYRGVKGKWKYHDQQVE